MRVRNRLRRKGRGVAVEWVIFERSVTQLSRKREDLTILKLNLKRSATERVSVPKVVMHAAKNPLRCRLLIRLWKAKQALGFFVFFFWRYLAKFLAKNEKTT